MSIKTWEGRGSGSKKCLVLVFRILPGSGIRIRILQAVRIRIRSRIFFGIRPQHYQVGTPGPEMHSAENDAEKRSQTNRSDLHYPQFYAHQAEARKRPPARRIHRCRTWWDHPCPPPRPLLEWAVQMIGLVLALCCLIGEVSGVTSCLEYRTWSDHPCPRPFLEWAILLVADMFCDTFSAKP